MSRNSSHRSARSEALPRGLLVLQASVIAALASLSSAQSKVAAGPTPWNGDNINEDALFTSDAVLGGTWTASVSIGHYHGLGGPIKLSLRAATINGPNFSSPIGGRLTEILIGGPFYASIFGLHNGVTGIILPQAVPTDLSLLCVPWAAQATTVGGGFADLSLAQSGVIGEIADSPPPPPPPSFVATMALDDYDCTPQGFTVECWVDTDVLGPGYDPRIVRASGPGALADEEIWELFACRLSACGGSGFIGFHIRDNGTSRQVLSTVSVHNTGCHHIAGTYDGNILRLYIDGALNGSLPAAGLDVTVGGGLFGAGIVMGDTTVNSNRYEGLLDDLRVWSVARSQVQIQAEMNTELGLVPGLVGYWKFNGDLEDSAGTNPLSTVGGSYSFSSGCLGQGLVIDQLDWP